MYKDSLEKSTCSDLACECGKLASLPFEKDEEHHLYCSISRIELSEDASRLVDRPAGRYVSIFFGNAWELEEDAKREISEKLGGELLFIMKKHELKDPKILVSGLGNREITHDSLGSRTCDSLSPCDKMAVFSVGVSANSGIDSAELVKSVARCAHADVVIAIDSLTALGSERVGRVIQISDTGISPGSGIGKHLKGINDITLGVPVISIGIATALATKNSDEKGYVSVSENVLLISQTAAELISEALNEITKA